MDLWIRSTQKFRENRSVKRTVWKFNFYVKSILADFSDFRIKHNQFYVKLIVFDSKVWKICQNRFHVKIKFPHCSFHTSVFTEFLCRSYSKVHTFVSLVLIFGSYVSICSMIWPTWAWWGHNLLLPRDILRSESDCFSRFYLSILG